MRLSLHIPLPAGSTANKLPLAAALRAGAAVKMGHTQLIDIIPGYGGEFGEHILPISFALAECPVCGAKLTLRAEFAEVTACPIFFRQSADPADRAEGGHTVN